MVYSRSIYQRAEGATHLLFWGFIFSAVNVSWQQDWFDVGLRPNTPAPLSVVLFPFLFYAHAFWAIPRYLSRRSWWRYGLSLILIFAGPELLRLLFYVLVLGRAPSVELTSRDSLLLGEPNAAWLAFLSSLVYKLLADRVVARPHEEIAPAKREEQPGPTAVVPPSEARALEQALRRLMSERQLYLQQGLDLSQMAEQLGITDKKLSAFLNQQLRVGFTDFVNEYRVDHFLERAAAGDLEQLSVAGLAAQCGFSSKTTFYRAFKKVKGCTPTTYLRA